MIENVSTQLTVFHCLCPLPASRKGLRLPLRSALFGEGGRDWRPCVCSGDIIKKKSSENDQSTGHFQSFFSLFFVPLTQDLKKIP